MYSICFCIYMLCNSISASSCGGCAYPFVPGTLLEGLFPYWIVLASLLKISWLRMYGIISGQPVLFRWSICIPVSHNLDYCHILKPRCVSTSTSLIFKTILSIFWFPFHFLMKFRIILSISLKTELRFDRLVLNL